MKNKYFTEYRKLGLSIVYFRKYKGLTQKQLADQLNVNYETISRIENANSGVSLDLLFALARILDVSVSELFLHAEI